MYRDQFNRQNAAFPIRVTVIFECFIAQAFIGAIIGTFWHLLFTYQLLPPPPDSVGTISTAWGWISVAISFLLTIRGNTAIERLMLSYRSLLWICQNVIHVSENIVSHVSRPVLTRYYIPTILFPTYVPAATVEPSNVIIPSFTPFDAGTHILADKTGSRETSADVTRDTRTPQRLQSVDTARCSSPARAPPPSRPVPRLAVLLSTPYAKHCHRPEFRPHAAAPPKEFYLPAACGYGLEAAALGRSKPISVPCPHHDSLSTTDPEAPHKALHDLPYAPAVGPRPATVLLARKVDIPPAAQAPAGLSPEWADRLLGTGRIRALYNTIFEPRVVDASSVLGPCPVCDTLPEPARVALTFRYVSPAEILRDVADLLAALPRVARLTFRARGSKRSFARFLPIAFYRRLRRLCPGRPTDLPHHPDPQDPSVSLPRGLLTNIGDPIPDHEAGWDGGASPWEGGAQDGTVRLPELLNAPLRTELVLELMVDGFSLHAVRHALVRRVYALVDANVMHPNHGPITSRVLNALVDKMGMLQSARQTFLPAAYRDYYSFATYAFILSMPALLWPALGAYVILFATMAAGILLGFMRVASGVRESVFVDGRELRWLGVRSDCWVDDAARLVMMRYANLHYLAQLIIAGRRHGTTEERSVVLTPKSHSQKRDLQ